MEAATNQTQAEQAEASLEAAIKHHEIISEGMPGSWSIETSEGGIMLVWSCEATDEATFDMCGDDPWSEWGGNAIIEDSGMPDFDDSGYDSYVDQNGDSIVSQWVEWKL